MWMRKREREHVSCLSSLGYSNRHRERERETSTHTLTCRHTHTHTLTIRRAREKSSKYSEIFKTHICMKLSGTLGRCFYRFFLSLLFGELLIRCGLSSVSVCVCAFVRVNCVPNSTGFSMLRTSFSMNQICGPVRSGVCPRHTSLVLYRPNAEAL